MQYSTKWNMIQNDIKIYFCLFFFHLDSSSGISKGSGFIKFDSPSSAQACVRVCKFVRVYACVNMSHTRTCTHSQIHSHAKCSTEHYLILKCFLFVELYIV